MAILVNGERIEADVITQEAERMRSDYERAFADTPADQREAQLLEWARDNVIERTLLEQAAKADPRPLAEGQLDAMLADIRQHRGEPPAGEGADPAAQADAAAADAALRADVEQHLRMRRVMEEAGQGLPEPTDDDVRAYYEGHLSEFTAPERVHAAHIVKHVSETLPAEVADAALQGAVKELEAGADFAAVAAKHSDCPENGGDLGWFQRGQMVEEFEHVVFRLRPGQVSPIFATRFGFHIVKMHDHKPAGPCGLKEAAPHIRERLIAHARNEAAEKYLDGLRAKATIQDVE